MATSTDTLQLSKVRTGPDWRRIAENIGALATAFLIGGLTVAAAQVAAQLHATPIALDLARATAVALSIVVGVAVLLRRESDDVVRRITEYAARNRNATEAVRHEQDRLCRAEEATAAATTRAADGVAGYNKELARLRGQVDGALAEQTAVLAKVEQRLAAGAVDAVTLYEMGVEQGRRQAGIS